MTTTGADRPPSSTSGHGSTLAYDRTRPALTCCVPGARKPAGAHATIAQPLQQPEQLGLVAHLGREVGLAREHGDLALGQGRSKQWPELAPHDNAPDPPVTRGGGA